MNVTNNKSTWSLIIDNIRELVVIIRNSDRIITFMNNAAITHVQKFVPYWTYDIMLTMTLEQVFVGLSQMEDNLKKTIQQGISTDFDEYFYMLNQWYHFRLFPDPEQNDHTVIISGPTIEISKHVEVQSIINDSEHHFVKTIIDSAPYGIVTCNVQARAIDWNPAAERLFGYNRDEIMLKDIDRILLPESLQNNSVLTFKELINNSDVINKTMRWSVQHKNGDTIDIELTIGSYSVKDEVFFTLFARNIHDVQSSEKALALIDERYQALRAVIEASGSDLFTVDLDCRFINVSESLKKHFEGITHMGHNNVELWGEQGKALDDVHKKVMSQGITLVSEESLVMNGQRHWFFITRTPKRDIYGKVTGMYGISWDITEQKRAQQIVDRVEHEEALHASKIKSQFIANISHEIRTPLNGINGMLTLLEITQLNDLQKDYVRDIRYSTDALLTIVNDILDISKIEANRIELEYAPYNLGNLLTDLGRFYKKTAESKGLVFTLDYQIPLQKMYITGDYYRVRQVLSNLLNNAIKFTFKGNITLKCEILEKQEEKDNPLQYLRFEIKDTGIGIPNNKKQKLFQAFTQAETSTTRRFGGTGLGLSISQSLVTLMGGKIAFESKEGIGSTFWIEIPYETSTPSITIQTDNRISQDNEDNEDFVPPTITIRNSFNDSLDTIIGTNLLRENRKHADTNILVVEDNDINRKVAVNFTKLLGYNVDSCVNGQEAVNIVKSHPEKYDAIIMDISMPIMDGYEATQLIRKLDSKSSNIPIIAMTAYAMKGESERAVAHGMTAYISKPFNIKILKDTLERVIK